MPVFLPVAGISINLFWLIALGVATGFLSGLLGIGGGILLTPVLILMGVRPTVAAASSSNAIVATCSSAAAAHFRLGNVDLKLGSILLAAAAAGAAISVDLINMLRNLGQANFTITLTYVVILSIVGGHMCIDGLRSLQRGTMPADSQPPAPAAGFLQALPLQVNFPRSRVRHSIIVVVIPAVLVGMLTAVMGVGGGFLVVPVMIYLLRVPLGVAVGTSLFQVLVTSAITVFMQAVENSTVDLELALLVGVGSTIGAQAGARLSRMLRAEHLKILLGVLALAVALEMAARITLTPSSLLSHVRMH